MISLICPPQPNPLCYRKLLGDDLVIVSLTMCSADRRERVLARYGGDSAAADLMDVSYDQS